MPGQNFWGHSPCVWHWSWTELQNKKDCGHVIFKCSLDVSKLRKWWTTTKICITQCLWTEKQFHVCSLICITVIINYIRFASQITRRTKHTQFLQRCSKCLYQRQWQLSQAIRKAGFRLLGCVELSARREVFKLFKVFSCISDVDERGGRCWNARI